MSTQLCLNSLKDQDEWEKMKITIPTYDIVRVRENTKEAPIWVHFGIGNIFRIFIAGLQDSLLNQGISDKGIICAETFDSDIIEKIYKPYDNLALAVTLKADGTTHKKVIGSLTEAIAASTKETAQWERLQDIFSRKSLQMVSFTVTEKGYATAGGDGKTLPLIEKDIQNGPDMPESAMAVLTSLLYYRYKHGAYPLAVVSMDNCSHNGEKLRDAVLFIAKAWKERGFVEEAFLDYIQSEDSVSFPWSMIDKITPRPSKEIADGLESGGLSGMQPVITEKNTYIAPFVNAEGPQYLVIEDKFPGGRPALEKAGVYFTDRETVNNVERMKVTTCLNPLHTALAVYGCLLGYTSIAEEMEDVCLKKLVVGIGPVEGMPVVCNPGILSPEAFVKEVIEQRLPNPFIPDTPQRIACDTSQKVGIRYGETIRSYVNKYGSAEKLHYIPLAIAGWLRYLLAVDDNGETYTLSPDPMAEQLQKQLEGIRLGTDETIARGKVRPILENAHIFGSNLYEAGIGTKIEDFFIMEIQSIGAVRRTLEKNV